MKYLESIKKMVQDVYISVYGEDKWNSLTDAEKAKAITFARRVMVDFVRRG